MCIIFSVVQAATEIGGDDAPPSVASAPTASAPAAEKPPAATLQPSGAVTEAPAVAAPERAEKPAVGGNGAPKGGDWESLEWRK